MLVAITGTVTVALTKLGDFLWQIIKDKREDKTKAQDKIEGHLESRITRLETENARCEGRVTRILRRLRMLENSNTQMKSYIQNIPADKGLLIYKEIPLPPEDDGDEQKPGTDVHEPISPSTPKGT